MPPTRPTTKPTAADLAPAPGPGDYDDFGPIDPPNRHEDTGDLPNPFAVLMATALELQAAKAGATVALPPAGVAAYKSADGRLWLEITPKMAAGLISA